MTTPLFKSAALAGAVLCMTACTSPEPAKRPSSGDLVKGVECPDRTTVGPVELRRTEDLEQLRLRWRKCSPHPDEGADGTTEGHRQIAQARNDILRISVATELARRRRTEGFNELIAIYANSYRTMDPFLAEYWLDQLRCVGSPADVAYAEGLVADLRSRPPLGYSLGSIYWVPPWWRTSLAERERDERLRLYQRMPAASPIKAGARPAFCATPSPASSS